MVNKGVAFYFDEADDEDDDFPVQNINITITNLKASKLHSYEKSAIYVETIGMGRIYII